jgi:hypothetical protein
MPLTDQKRFLQTIGQLESSGGQNTNHEMMDSGIQAGTAAIGKYGLMPNTVKELVNRRRIRGTSTPELQQLGEMPPDKMKAYIEANPGLEDQLANELATKVITRQNGDPDRAAYSWKQGDNLKPDEISNEQLDANPYVQKFRRLNQVITNPDQSQDDNGN